MASDFQGDFPGQYEEDFLTLMADGRVAKAGWLMYNHAAQDISLEGNGEALVSDRRMRRWVQRPFMTFFACILFQPEVGKEIVGVDAESLADREQGGQGRYGDTAFHLRDEAYGKTCCTGDVFQGQATLLADGTQPLPQWGKAVRLR
ncbi:hypothetical protein AD944_10795 [Acetobacter tropicalis]|nr:hypothetical protein AD944_10795 [Acetobacter tropicalis]